MNDPSLLERVSRGFGLTIWTSVLIARGARAEASFVDAVAPPIRRFATCAPIIAFATLAREPGPTLASATAAIAIVIAAFGDARTGYLFDAITLPAAIVTALLAIAAGDSSGAASGAALLVGSFGGIHVLSRGRAIGLGDVKVMYVIGAAFGPLASIVAVFAASLTAIALHVYGARGRTPGSREMPFGTSLAVGTAFALIGSDRVLHGMLGL